MDSWLGACSDLGWAVMIWACLCCYVALDYAVGVYWSFVLREIGCMLALVWTLYFGGFRIRVVMVGAGLISHLGYLV